MWPMLGRFAWYRRIDGYQAGRVFTKLMFYVGMLIVMMAFFAIYYDDRQGGKGDGGRSPVPEGPLEFPKEFRDRLTTV